METKSEDHNDRSKRKRKRPRDGKRRRHAAESPQTAVDGERTKRRGPLHGMQVAVTTLKDSSKEDSPDSYQSIVDLCEHAGTTTTRQVHKRVNCVVATQSAYDGATARVRKASKKGIPVVAVDWVRECIKLQRKVSYEKYVFQQRYPEEEPMKKKRKRSPSPTSPTLAGGDDEIPSFEGARHVDLGCCCVCHENGDADCPWCVECSVAKSSRSEE